MNRIDDWQFKRDISAAEYALKTMVKCTGNAADLKQTAYALRLAKSENLYPEILAYALAFRRQWRLRHTLIQRDWQTKVSRRPQRGNHHDSWSIREQYVRVSNS